MTFDQVMARTLGILKVDPEKVAGYVKIFREKFPHAIVTVNEGSVKASVIRDEAGVHCMKCGNLMISRVNQYVKKGLWIQKKRRDNISCWECLYCAPLIGGQPLMCVYDDGYFPVDLIELRKEVD